MRICIISQYFPPDMGGASTRVSNAIKGLRSRGHDIFVVTAFPHYPHGDVPSKYRKRAFVVEGDRHVSVFRVWVPALPHEGAKRLVMYASFTLFSLLSLPFSGEVDVVWALSPNYFSAISGFFYKMLKRVPLVLDVVDLWPEALVNLGVVKSKSLIRLINATVLLSYKLSDRILTLNQGMKREILLVEKSPEKVSIVPNTVDVNVFRPLSTKRIAPLINKFVIMYSGNLGPMYDFDTVLDSAKKLSHFESIIFVLRGSGEQAEDIRQKIKNLGLNNVLLLDQVLETRQVVEFLNMADLFLLPMKKLKNTEISYPIKLTEYFACGKPIICCAEGETAKLVSLSNAGYTVPPANSRELSEKILKLYLDQDKLSELGQNARIFAIAHFSVARMGTRLEQTVQTSIKGDL